MYTVHSPPTVKVDITFDNYGKCYIFTDRYYHSVNTYFVVGNEKYTQNDGGSVTVSNHIPLLNNSRFRYVYSDIGGIKIMPPIKIPSSI